MKYPEFEYPLTIREHHLDTFGHVNNATYLTIFEEARWEMVTRGGFGLAEVCETGLGPTALEIRIKFKREVRNRERVVIRSRLLEYKSKIGRFSQEMLNESGDICCELEMTLALFDTNKRKLVAPTPEWKRALGMEA